MKLTGTGVALVNPFKGNGSIDELALRKLVGHQIENGTDFLVVLGTTGESATLSQEEQDEVLAIVIDENQKKLPIVLGMGGNNTAELCRKMAAFDNPDVDAFLSASPHYNKPTQQGIIEHFKALAQVSTRPIILYNVPGRTASNMTAETTIELSQVDNIIAVKEASGNIDQVMQIIDKSHRDFLVLSGEDALTMPIVALGGHGVISVVANAFPNQFSEMIKSTLANDLDKARSLHYQLLDLINLLFAEGNPAGIKYCLKELNICENELRLPLVPISEQLQKRIQEELQTKQLN
jgi:4-hydroxy-tetrahydrodipicolinate synthase